MLRVVPQHTAIIALLRPAEADFENTPKIPRFCKMALG